LSSARSLRQSLGRQVGLAPHLAGLAQRIEDCARVVAEINHCMDEAGEIRDSASPMLARIRATLREAHERVLRQLNRLITSPETAGYLQEPIITQRNARYVIPLRVEFKGKIPGIVHDQSASGATLFIEPLSTVELNNEWRELQLAEQAEIRRILARLSELIVQEAPFIERTVGILAELDLIFAKAKYAQALRAVSPELVPFEKPHPVAGDAGIVHPGSVIELLRARHPLLDPQTVVPIDVRLGPDYFVLVITGPNTGGKTVALKTVGLLAAMAQAGMAIPTAEGARLSVFDGIYADIGDEQSIEQSLSTFSSHMNNIVDILQKATSRSLVVLDELGAGTDPEEGSALAQAILSQLVTRRITTFATTHYSELKIYAHSAPGVQNASVEFDPETLRPTYELTIGLPGRSNALAIARRLGLDERIIADAARRVSAEALQAESLLDHLKNTQQQARRELEMAQAARREAERLRDELRQKLAAIEEARRQVLAETREQARQELAELRKEIERLRAEAEEARRTLRQAPAGPALRSLSQEVEALEETWRPVQSPQAPAEEAGPWVPPKVGDRVWIEGLSVEGEVIGTAGEEVELQAGSLRLRLPARQVRVRRQAMPVTEPAPAMSFDID
ncbi:MAG: endonuclease MutS2, partial [Anaerolineae bacterium]